MSERDKTFYLGNKIKKENIPTLTVFMTYLSLRDLKKFTE